MPLLHCGACVLQAYILMGLLFNKMELGLLSGVLPGLMGFQCLYCFMALMARVVTRVLLHVEPG